jgi:hypothetical protein
MSKEMGKILLKSKELLDPAVKVPGVALMPLAEGMGNTLCPSIVGDVQPVLRAALAESPFINLRNADLSAQALERLPEEARGNTLPVEAELWADVAMDLQADLLITGRVVGKNPPEEGREHATWDYLLEFEAFQVDAKRKEFERIYRSRLTYNAVKDPTLTRKEGDFEAIYLPAHAGEIPLLVSQIRFFDLNPVLLGGHLWESETVLQYGKKELDGAYFPTGFYVDSPLAHVRRFSEEYLKRFAQRPDLLAAQAYDAAGILLKALERASDPEDIARKILLTRQYDGVSGRTDFDGKAEAEKTVPILRIKDGRYEQVQ